MTTEKLKQIMMTTTRKTSASFPLESSKSLMNEPHKKTDTSENCATVASELKSWRLSEPGMGLNENQISNPASPGFELHVYKAEQTAAT